MELSTENAKGVYAWGRRRVNPSWEGATVTQSWSGFPTEFAGARESNAGDEFHVLWGVRLCLEMIRPDSPLQRVVMEGVSPNDRSGASHRAFLAADITEYHGGENFADATKVIVSQLRYSHRNPSDNWTPAQLAPKRQHREQTTLGKLIDVFLGLCAQYGQDEVLRKLRIRLVSNRPASPRLQSLVKEFQASLPSGSGSSSRSVIPALPKNLRRSYDLLLERSGLDEGDFAGFMRILDLDYLGSGDRFRQECRIIKNLADHVLGSVASSFHSLCELVRKEALPEASRSPGISPDDVLAQFGVMDRLDLLPSPSRVESPKRMVKQQSTKHLSQIIASGVQRVVAHGNAGVGKTTAVLDLQDALPPNSIIVLYDCFGGGEYLGPTERRHDPQHAVMQLVNEIALKCGTPLLLPGALNQQTLWRRLAKTLGDAATSLNGGHLVLVIDAADNAIVASGQRQGEACFVPDLWKLPLPRNVHVVMTCRSARLELLEAPDNAQQVELHGFDQTASAEYLRLRFPEATDRECDRFHTNSGGNPRVQSYVLDQDRPGYPGTLVGCISQAETTLAESFQSLLDTALHSLNDPSHSKEWTSVLMALERPIHLRSLAEVLGVSEEDVHRFCGGLVPGVRVQNQTVVFRDEDFESYIRSVCSEQDLLNAHNRIADRYMDLRSNHDWAARAVAGHLFNAARAEDLVTLTLQDRQPSAISDPLTRNQVFLDRIRLALRFPPSSDHSDSLKLIMLAMSMKRVGFALSSLIQDHPELAMQYADPVAVARVYANKRTVAWKGPLHMRVAASTARRGEIDIAHSQLLMAKAWLRRWSELDDRSRRRWRLKMDDLAASAEAIFYLEGSDAAAAFVRGWRPRRRIAGRLVERLARGPRRGDLALYIDQQNLPIEVEAYLLATLFRNGGIASSSQIKRVCRELVGSPPSDLDESQDHWPADLLDQAASVLSDRDLLDLIEAFRPTPPSREPDFGLGDWVLPLRIACLEAVLREIEFDAEALLPRRLRETAQADEVSRQSYRLAEERERLLRLLREASPVFLFRASCVAGRIETDEVLPRAMQLLKHFVDSRYRNNWQSRLSWAAEAVFEGISFTNAAFVEPIKLLLETRRDDIVPLGTWLQVGESILRRGIHISSALQLVDRVVYETQQLDEPSHEKSQRLVRCAALVDSVNSTLARDYYFAAIKASEEMDEEGSLILHMIDRLADRAIGSDAIEGSLDVTRLRQAVEHFHPFVYDPSTLPWADTLATITRLDPDQGIRTLTRWDEAGYLRLEEGIFPVAKALANGGTVSIIEAIQLYWLTEESHSCTDSAIEILEQARRDGVDRRYIRAAVGWLSERIAKHLTFETRLSDADTLAKWIRANGFDNVPWADHVLAIHETARNLPDHNHKIRESLLIASTSDQSQQDQIDKLLAQASNDNSNVFATRLEQLAELQVSSGEMARYLSLFGCNMSPDLRVPSLEAIYRLPIESQAWSNYSDAISKGLEQWLSAWINIDSVRNWSKERLPQFLLDRFPNVVGYHHEGKSTLDDLLRIASIEDSVGILAKATSQHLQSLTPQQLILIAKLMADRLPYTVRLENLTWLLNELLGHGDPPANTHPTSGQMVLADLSWALLGHPDKRIRWRAAHFVLDRSRRSDPLLKHLMRHFDDATGLGFYAPTSAFLWMSAQVWALVALRRAAVEHPAAVSLFAPLLYRVATNKEWPHALLRELARCTLLELPIETIDSETICRTTVEFANQPTACQIREPDPRVLAQEPVENTRFRFNQMDTVPYWFTPLSNVFGIGSREVEAFAEVWVVDHLGYDSQGVRLDRPKLGNRYGIRDYHNDHGSQPRVENLRTYLEWHAMFLVAGELADSGRPTATRHYYDSSEDSWREWLTSYLNRTDGLWLSDHRSPVPIECYRYRSSPAPETWRNISDDEFDRELVAQDAVVVDAFIEYSHGSLYEHITLDSALVVQKLGESLLNTLQNTPTIDQPHFPRENTYHDPSFDKSEFPLLSWLTDVSQFGFRLEDHNPVGRIEDLRVIVPGRDFQTAMSVRPSPDTLIGGPHANVHPVATRRWSDKHVERRGLYRSKYTEGRQTIVQAQELQTFLSSTNKALLLRVRVSRHFESQPGWSGHEQDKRYDPGTVRVYLYREDGTLSTG